MRTILTETIPPIDQDVKLAIADATQALVRLEDALDNIRGTIAVARPLQWNGRRQVTKSLRWMLSIYARWLHIKRLFLNGVETVGKMHVKYDRTVRAPSMSNIKRRTVKYHLNSKPADECKPIDFDSGFPHPTTHAAVHQVNQWWKELIAQSTQDYYQVRELLVLPEWNKALKKHMPVGGREAYSVLMVCHSGWSHKTLSDQNRLFGWYESGSNTYQESQEILYNLKKVSRAIQSRLPESRGPAPSWEKGSRVLHRSAYVIQRGRDYNTRLSDLLHKYNERTVDETATFAEQYSKRLIEHNLLCGHSSPGCLTAGLLKLVRWPQWSADLHHAVQSDTTFSYHDRKVAAAIVRKVMGMSSEDRRKLGNQVPTILTGPVRRASGDDYYAPCVYADSFSRDPVGRSEYRTRKGWVLFRRHWPDMYHYANPTEPTHEQIAAQLDAASRYFFRNQQDEKERQLSAKQRKANILRKLRALPALTRDDSYASGNCQPGTEQFITTLQARAGLPATAAVDGKILARCWKRAEYIQLDNLSKVATYLTDMAAEAKARQTQANPEVAAHTPQAPELEYAA